MLAISQKINVLTNRYFSSYCHVNSEMIWIFVPDTNLR